MKTEKLILLGVIAGGALILLSNKNAGSNLGRATGNAVGGAVTSFVTEIPISAGKAVIINPYERARDYKGYIPIIDDAAFLFSNNPNRFKMSAYEYEKNILGWKV